MMTYTPTPGNVSASLGYLYSLARYGTKPGLVIMRALMEELGHPEQKFKSIHITGTNGKGSTAALIASALITAGYRTALYTSPHLYAFNERMLINDQPILDEQLTTLIDRVRHAAERASVQPTFFEFTTAIAFTYFAEQNIDMAVVEVGMGGERDATNIITPEVSVITNIDLDHTDIIGPSLRDITREKAGIIKPTIPVVVGQTSAESKGIITARADQHNAPLYQAATAVQVRRIGADRHHQTCQATGLYHGTFTVSLLGDHQLLNIAVALTSLQILSTRGFPVRPADISAGFATTRWEGRLDIVSEEPFILVDGAHNDASFQALHQFITAPTTALPSYDVLLTGLKQGKEARILRDNIAPLFTKVITTEGAYQPTLADELARELSKKHQHVEAITDPQAALAAALQHIGSNGTLLVAGSLYLIPIILAKLRHRQLNSPLIP